MNDCEIPWWKTSMGQLEAQAANAAIANANITMGPMVSRLEASIAEAVEVPYAVATPSGSAALVLSLMALGVGPGDEVIVPNRTFIGTANAALLLGARVVLAPVRSDLPLIDVDALATRISPRTKAIVVVHLNGMSAEMARLNDVAKRSGIQLVEDACQAMFSRNEAGYLGTQSRVGCFSLGVTKLVSCGFGGVVVTRDAKLYDRMIRMRNQGLDCSPAGNYELGGFNFKCSDILAAIGLVQLAKRSEKMQHIHAIYARYCEAIDEMPFLDMLPINVAQGELPLYAIVMCSRRAQLMKFLQFEGIQTRPLPPDLCTAPHLAADMVWPATSYSRHGLILPCGPDQPLRNVEHVIEALHRFCRERTKRRRAVRAPLALPNATPRDVGVGT